METYEHAIDYLDGQGVIDRSRVGISGFSRTVFHVSFALTHSPVRFGAVVLTDGLSAGYFERLVFTAFSEADALNGGRPFGEGLKAWIKNAPGFNLDRVHSPVRVVAQGPNPLLLMWELYAGLAIQRKPVEMAYFPEATHTPVKPWERQAEQQGVVDWFCFWLKGEEDPDPGKAEQYARWHKLRELHDADLRRSQEEQATNVAPKAH